MARNQDDFDRAFEEARKEFPEETEGSKSERPSDGQKSNGQGARERPLRGEPLRLDAAAVRAALENASKDKVVELFLELAFSADLNPVDIDTLRRLAAKKSGVGLRPLTSMLKEAQAKQAVQRAEAAKARRCAERTDPRPMLREPDDTDPWIPVMDEVNGVLGASTAPEPPTRDIDGYMTRSRKISMPGLHLFSTANKEPDDGLLPAPEQWLLCRMGEIEVAELIERHIDYVNAAEKSVHLKTKFVKHYLRRDDDALPLAATIAVLPIVLADGVLLAPEGLDRKRGIIFKVPKELRDMLPRREDCNDEAVCKAMKFLCDDWLCDVATTDYAGKCVLLAIVLTMIERTLLPERPVFWVTAGKARSGKTTALTMLIMAATGERPAAAAWSNDEEERRKALLGYLLSGVSYVLWDNIVRGAQISCPHIEKACTAQFYSDRRLGVSDIATAAAAAIHLLTGNNVGPRGDLASRSLRARLTADRPDPENRAFKHPDPVAWTESNRAKILQALYTILLGNPMLKQPRDVAGGTRFKAWYRLVGSALEHAARLVKAESTDPVQRETMDREMREKMDRIAAQQDVDFQKLFLVQETEGDDDSSALGEALTVLDRRWPDPVEFKAAEVSSLINREGADSSFIDSEGGEEVLREMKRDGTILRDFLYGPVLPANFVASARSVGKLLNAHVDEPIQVGDEVLVLRKRKSLADNSLVYFVSKTKAPSG